MTKKFSIHEEIKGIAILIILGVVMTLFVFGCDDGGGVPRKDPAFTAQVNAALDEIERRGLPEWAAYGREREASIVEGECGGGFAYTLFTQTSSFILLSSRWRTEIDVGGQGEVLLEELHHLQTCIVSHTPALYALLEKYNTYQETPKP